MELRRLALLRELSRRGTIAAAAQALSYSHSSVSVQLAELEKEAGTALLRRVGRNVELTAAGRRLAAHADQALAADEAVRTELAALADVPSGRIRMTFVQTPAIALLPGTLEHLAASAPQVQVDVIQRETAPALEELRSHAVELVVGIEYDPLPVGRRRDDHREDLIREDVLVTLHRDHPAARQPGPVRLAGLQDATWAAGHPGTPRRRSLPAATASKCCQCRRPGKGPQIPQADRLCAGAALRMPARVVVASCARAR
jgi:DNA-binding transcriptional LysR family regulator